jgi:hypothetical protein
VFLIVNDVKRLINFSLHVGGPLTDAELAVILANIDATAEALAHAPEAAFSTTVVLVESENGLNAAQRKRLGEASRKITRSHQVLITRSAVARAVMTAIRWFSPPGERERQATFATYEEARTWLVERTSHPADVFDRMLRELRAEARAKAAIVTRSS